MPSRVKVQRRKSVSVTRVCAELLKQLSERDGQPMARVVERLVRREAGHGAYAAPGDSQMGGVKFFRGRPGVAAPAKLNGDRAADGMDGIGAIWMPMWVNTSSGDVRERESALLLCSMCDGEVKRCYACAGFVIRRLVRGRRGERRWMEYDEGGKVHVCKA